MSLSTKRFSRQPAILTLVTAAGLLAGGTAIGQTGVAPSQTGQFFDELRNRANLFRQGAVDESARTTGEAGVYDYSRGEYVGESYDERPLGERAPIGDDLTRALGTQTYRAGYIGSSKRSSGDFTGASSSPYPTTSTYFAPTYLTDPFLAGKRNIKLGPVNIGFGLAANVEYNDNITQAHDDKLEDVIAGLYLNTDANWVFSRQNRLTLSVTAGLDYYINNPEQAPSNDVAGLGREGLVFTVLPGSTLAFDFSVGDVVFTVYDRVSVRPSTGSEFQVSNEDQFGSFQNDFGIAANWAINSKLNLSLNFNRADTWETGDEVTTQQEFVTGGRQAPANAYDRTINSISGSLAWTPTGSYTVGLEGSLSAIDYEQNYNNDSTTLTGGVFIVLPITRSTILKASAGWQEMEFDASPAFTPATDPNITSLQEQNAQLQEANANLAATGTSTGMTTQQVQKQIEANQAKIEANNQQIAAAQTSLDARNSAARRSNTRDTNDSLGDYYYNVTLFNQLNARISHQFSFGHESSLNSNSNFVTADYASYGIGIIAWRGARLSLSGYYENADESGGNQEEDTEQWGIDALLSHRLTDRLTVGLGYHYGNTDATPVGVDQVASGPGDYEQHAYSLDFSYMLNQKMTIGLGYRFLRTDAADELQSFDQNRVTLTMNYNF